MLTQARSSRSPGCGPDARVEPGGTEDNGAGFGIHAIWMNAPPGAPFLGVSAAKFGIGALADFRYYFATIEPLTLYPTLSAGFLAGPGVGNGGNAVLPLINPGFGAKVRMGSVYAAFEFGFAGFTIPYVALCFGFQGDRHKERAEAWAREQLEHVEQAKAH